METRARNCWFAVALVLVCCGRDPYQFAEINLEGTPIAEGALAGMFAIKAVAATLVEVPIPGISDKLGGGHHVALIRRSWDDDQGVYLQTTELCGGRNYKVHATVADPDDQTYRKVPISTNEIVQMDHETGHYQATGHVQLWAIRDLPDPQTTPLPKNRKEAKRAPHRDRIYDMDGDGRPGYTTYVKGLANGKAYTILRKRVSFDGVTRSPDLVHGLNDTLYDSLLLDWDGAMVKKLFGGDAPKYPDPAESWFEEIRVGDDADCDHTLRLDGDETLSKKRPF